MIRLSPKKTFLYLAKRLLEHGDRYNTIESARLIVNGIIDSSLDYEFTTVHTHSVDDESNLVFAVGEFDKEKSYNQMHVHFIEGHLAPVHGLDKCVVSRGYSAFFASLDYARKLLNAPDLTEHQLRLIVECASASRLGEEYMTDYLLHNAYHRMVGGFVFYGIEEEEDKWNVNIKHITNKSNNTNLVDSYTVSSRDELIDSINTHLGYDSQDIRNFVNSGHTGEIHTPDMVIMYKPVGSCRKIYLNPETKNKCNDIQLKV